VDSSGTLATLLSRSLVTIKGPVHRGPAGRCCTVHAEFLNYFGLKDLAELPRPEELRALGRRPRAEQLEMLELDATGLPLAFGRGGSLRARSC
jgi:chromosome segregation and condensation protein ScpB